MTNYTAIGYVPQETYYGQEFLYDGIHGIQEYANIHGIKGSEAWKSDILPIREAYITYNKSLVDNMQKLPVSDIADWVTGATAQNSRIRQVIDSNSVWESIQEISNGNGTVIGFDTETIGDVLRSNLHDIGGKTSKYDGFAGITEIGFSHHTFMNGELVGNAPTTTTIAVGLNKNQLDRATTALASYKNNGLSSISDDEARMLEWFSSFGKGNSAGIFGLNEVSFLGNEKFVTINTSALSTPDLYDTESIRRGIERWANLNNNYGEYVAHDRVIGLSVQYINEQIKQKTPFVASNIGFDITALSYESNMTLDAKGLYEGTADTTSALAVQAAAHNSSIYTDMSKHGNPSPATPASTDSAMQVSGLARKEIHHAGQDAQDEVAVAINRYYTEGKSFAQRTIDATATQKSIINGQYGDNYYIFQRAYLDKNSMDHAIVDGEVTQNYSFRNRFLSIDTENSGYVQSVVDPSSLNINENGVLTVADDAEYKTSYVLSLTDEDGNIIRKEFENEMAAQKFIEEQSISVRKNGQLSESSKRVGQRAYQDEMTNIDLGRRNYDKALSVSDISVNSQGKISGGFADMERYVNAYQEIERSGMSLDDAIKAYHNGEASDSLRKSLDSVLYSNTSERAFIGMYDRLQSESDVLEHSIKYINENIKTEGAKGIEQKTVALNQMLQMYKNTIEEQGYSEYIRNPKQTLVQDIYGIDIKIGDEYVRINGQSEASIRRDLSRVFKDIDRDVIADSIDELGTRGVLLEPVSDNISEAIRNLHTARTYDYNTIYSDVAIALKKVTDPINDYSYGPLSFMEYIEEKKLSDDQYTAIAHKIVSSENDIAHSIEQNRMTQFSIDGTSPISFNEAFRQIRSGITDTREKDIINLATSSRFVEQSGVSDVITALGKELGYRDDQISILQDVFGTEKNYSLGKNQIQSFIINPVDDESSAFVLLTDRKHSSRVHDFLSSNTKSFTSRAQLQEEVNGFASVMELKRIENISLGSFSDFGLNETVEELYGKNGPTISTLVQSKNSRRFITPEVSGFLDKEKEQYVLTIKQPGSEYVGTTRKSMGKVIEAIKEGDFEKASRILYQNANDVIKDMSSPSSARAYKDEAGNMIRAYNYNLNDISHAFYFDASGIKDFAEYEVQQLAKAEAIDNPLYQVVRQIGINNRTIHNNEIMSESTIHSIMNSSGWNEFYSKNILIGKVGEDAAIRESLNGMVGLDKNLLEMMIDVATEGPITEKINETTIKTLSSIEKVSPFISQLLNEHNVENNIWTFKSPGEIADFAGLSSSMRPTFGQMLNGLNFTPDKELEDIAEYFGGKIGAVSRSKTEQTIRNILSSNEKFLGPNGKPFGEQEHSIFTTFKQMSDAELQTRYKELESVFTSRGEDWAEAFNVFRTEYMSLNEGKFFGAPMMFNHEVFTTADNQRIRISQLEHIQSKKDLAETLNITRNLINKEITAGTVIGKHNGKSIYYNGPTTILTQEVLNDFFETGEAVITPSQRMVQDIKVMFQQEKGTLHTILVNDEFVANHPVFQSKQHALDMMQEIFDSVMGNDGFEYKSSVVANISTYKHSTDIATQSLWNLMVNEYDKAGRMNYLMNEISRMPEFNGWFDSNSLITGKNGLHTLINDTADKSGLENAILALYNSISTNDVQNPEISALNNKIKSLYEEFQSRNVAIGDLQRTNVNEIMGTQFTLDERIQQAIRLRSLENQTYYTEPGAVNGILDGINGKNGKSWSELYIEELKERGRSGQLNKMITEDLDTDNGLIKKFVDEITEDRLSGYSHQRKMQADQVEMLGGFKESLMYYVGDFNPKEKDVIEMDIQDVISRMGKKKNFTSEDLQDFLFKVDGTPSDYLLELTDGMIDNKKSIYLKFGTNIDSKVVKDKTFDGILIPLMNVNTMQSIQDQSTREAFFNRSQGSIVRFLNIFNDNIGTKDGKAKISSAIEDLYSSFAKEMLIFDKDSLIYKAMGKELLPHSGQSLAQDEVPALVESIYERLSQDPDDMLSLKKEKQLREAIRNGDNSAIKPLNELLEERKKVFKEIAEEIRNDTADESSFVYTALNGIGKSHKGWQTVSINGVDKKVFSNAFETSLENFKRAGVDTGIIGMQLYSNVDNYITNEAFMSKYADEIADIEEQIRKRTTKDFEPGKAIQALEDSMMSIKDINESIAKSKTLSSSQKKIFETEMAPIFESLGELYLKEVGISSELFRYPVFSTQGLSVIYLSNDLHGNQMRALNAAISKITNVDFDGDTLSHAFLANGLGLRSKKDLEYFLNSYAEGLTVNNGIIADLIEEGASFKVDAISDAPMSIARKIERFDKEVINNYASQFIEQNGLKFASPDELLEDAGWMESFAHSDLMEKAINEFSSKSNMLTNKQSILASITARIRKPNIGYVSTPNFRLRDVLTDIAMNPENKDIQEHVFEIMRALTRENSTGLLDISEQKAIDVKHILDAVNIAETPKWTKGMSLLFTTNDTKKRQQGLDLMIQAVNKSTFNADKETTQTYLEDILSHDMKYFKEQLNVGTKAEKELANFKYQFRALYESADLPDAMNIFKSALRQRNVTAYDVAKALELLMQDGKEHTGAIDDVVKAFQNAESQERLLVDKASYYINPGSFENGESLKQSLYRFSDLRKNKDGFAELVMQEVNPDTFEDISGSTMVFGGKQGESTYRKINEKFTSVFGKNGINKYYYENNYLGIRTFTDTEASVNRIDKLIRSVLNTNVTDVRKKLDSYSGVDPSVLMIKDLFQSRKVRGNANEVIEDLEYAIGHRIGNLDANTGVDALITQLNRDIAQHPEKYKNQTYDVIIKQMAEKQLGGEVFLDQASQARKMFGDISIKEEIDFLNNNTYDIINGERKLTQQFSDLQALREELTKSEKFITDKETFAKIVSDIDSELTQKDSIIQSIVERAQASNDKVIREQESKVYKKFETFANKKNFGNSKKAISTNTRMESFFGWGNIGTKSQIGFGEYLGKQFGQLSQTDIDRILKTDISAIAAKDLSSLTTSDFAKRRSIEALQQYVQNNNPAPNTVSALSSRRYIGEINNVLERHKSIFDNRNILPSTAQSRLDKTIADMHGIGNKKSITNIGETIKNFDIKKHGKTVAGVAGAMVALGVLNNLIHNEKTQSPLSPARTSKNNNAPVTGHGYHPSYPDVSSQAMGPQMAEQAPMTNAKVPQQKKTVYHDNQSGLNFKVSAKTRNKIDAINNANMIRNAGGGNAQIYTQQDNSKISDNWLANKFAELT